jgi:hypothetical protein
VGVGDEHRLEGLIALLDDLAGALDQRRLVQRLIDGAHVAKSEMRIDADLVAHLAAQKTPDRQALILAEDVPQRQLDAGDRAHADGAQTPEGMLAQDADGLLDVARIGADQQRLEILDRADHGLGLPFERRLAPAIEARHVGLDLDENPVAHLRVHDAGPDGGDLQGRRSH